MKERLFALLVGILISVPVLAEGVAYQMTNKDGEVLFIETVTDNPNIGNIRESLKNAGYADFKSLSRGMQEDVWCKLSSVGESPFLYVECYEPHPVGVSYRRVHNPTAELGGYAAIPRVINEMRRVTLLLAELRKEESRKTLKAP